MAEAPISPVIASASDHARNPILRLAGWLKAGQNHRGLPFAVFFLLLAGITVLMFWIAAVPTFRFGHDIIAMLDGGWRVLHGERPYEDFYSGFGPLPFLLFAAGLKVSGGTVQGVGYMNAMLSVLLGMAAWLVCRARMYPVVAVLASIAVPLIAIAPFPVGEELTTLGQAMSYNRVGYALIALVVLESWQRAGSGREELLGGWVSGCAAALATFEKANYFAPAAALLIGSLLFGRDRWRIAGIAAGFGMASIALLAFLRFDIAAMLRELSTAAAARATDVSRPPLGLLTNVVLVSVLLFAVSALEMYGPDALSQVERWRIGLGAAIVVVAGAVLTLTNHQRLVLPLNAIFLLVLLNEVLRHVKLSTPFVWYYAALVLIALVSSTPDMIVNAYSIGYAARLKLGPVPASVERIQAAPLAELFLYEYGDGGSAARSNGRAYAVYINDGVALLNRYANPSDKILTFDQFNPFPFALHRPPPHGGAVALDYLSDFTDAHKPTPKFLLGDADILMYPKFPSAPNMTVEALQRNYGGDVDREFRLCAESERWRMYRRFPRVRAGRPPLQFPR